MRRAPPPAGAIAIAERGAPIGLPLRCPPPLSQGLACVPLTAAAGRTLGDTQTEGAARVQYGSDGSVGLRFTAARGPCEIRVLSKVLAGPCVASGFPIGTTREAHPGWAGGAVPGGCGGRAGVRPLADGPPCWGMMRGGCAGRRTPGAARAVRAAQTRGGLLILARRVGRQAREPARKRPGEPQGSAMESAGPTRPGMRTGLDRDGRKGRGGPKRT